MKYVASAADSAGALHLEARVIPIPQSISPEAQTFLATTYPQPDQPPISDKAGWKKMVADFNKSYEPMADQVLATMPATVEPRTMGGVTVYVGTPHAMRHQHRAHMTVHGGGWVFLGVK